MYISGQEEETGNPLNNPSPSTSHTSIDHFQFNLPNLNCYEFTFTLTTYDSTKFSWTANQDLPSLLILHLFVIRRSLLFIDISQQSYQGFHYNLPGGVVQFALGTVFFSDFKSCDLIITKRNLFLSSKCLASNFRTI